MTLMPFLDLRSNLSGFLERAYMINVAGVGSFGKMKSLLAAPLETWI
jgi:hypothetical protein